MVRISTSGEKPNNCLPIVWATWIVVNAMTSKEGWWGPYFSQSYNIWLIHVPTSRSTTKSIFLLQYCNIPNMIVGVYSWEPFQGKPTVDLFNFFTSTLFKIISPLNGSNLVGTSTRARFKDGLRWFLLKWSKISLQNAYLLKN